MQVLSQCLLFLIRIWVLWAMNTQCVCLDNLRTLFEPYLKFFHCAICMGYKVNSFLNVLVCQSQWLTVKNKIFLNPEQTLFPYICRWREILSDDSHRSRGNRGFVVKKVTSWSLFCAAGQSHLWVRGNCHCLSLGQFLFSYCCKFTSYQNKLHCEANDFAKMQLLRRLYVKWWKRMRGRGEKRCCQNTISYLVVSSTLQTIHENALKATDCDLTFRLSFHFSQLISEPLLN